MHYLYLAIDIATIFFPFAFSFEKKICFYKRWKYLLPAIIMTAIPFLIWDHFYTTWSVWGFNDKYITGVKFFNLPIEEILFFFTIPYACMFIYEYLNKILGDAKKSFFDRYQTAISTGTVVICLTLFIIHFNQIYTSVICFVLVLLLCIQTFIIKAGYMGKYWRFFVVMLIPFFIVNSVLTGTGIPGSVFWYNKDSIMNFRLGTIPLEDLFFSLALMLINISVYEWFKRSNRKFLTRKASRLRF